MCYSAESNLQNKTFLKKYRGNLVNVKVCAILSELIPIQGFSYDYSPGSGPFTTELIISRLPLKIIKIIKIIIIKNTYSNKNYPHAFDALEIGGLQSVCVLSKTSKQPDFKHFIRHQKP